MRQRVSVGHRHQIEAVRLRHYEMGEALFGTRPTKLTVWAARCVPDVPTDQTQGIQPAKEHAIVGMVRAPKAEAGERHPLLCCNRMAGVNQKSRT